MSLWIYLVRPENLLPGCAPARTGHLPSPRRPECTGQQEADMFRTLPPLASLVSTGMIESPDGSHKVEVTNLREGERSQCCFIMIELQT